MWILQRTLGIHVNAHALQALCVEDTMIKDARRLDRRQDGLCQHADAVRGAWVSDADAEYDLLFSSSSPR